MTNQQINDKNNTLLWRNSVQTDGVISPEESSRQVHNTSLRLMLSKQTILRLNPCLLVMFYYYTSFLMSSFDIFRCEKLVEG